ncbi:MAG: hypothetical protein JWP97_3289 [Labilithrix sp.]|nr:hypothetical protein [Labilithrix sp.]
MRTGLSIALATGLALFAPAAFAQDTPPPATGDGALPPPKVVTKTTVETSTAGPRRAEEEDPTSDHEKVVGHIGVGYLGLTNLPIATGGTGGIPARGNVAAPVIGVRYWLGEKIGLDLGLGLGVTGGSTEVVSGNTTTTTDLAGVFGLSFHGGVPIALAHQKHYKFLVIPELNVGFATQTETPAANAGGQAGDITRNGFHLDVGGRVGSEIHFGFIGVPQLSLQATVGLLFARNAWKVKQDVGNQTNSASAGETSLGTTVQGDPWAIFVNNISAIYYLP